MPSRTPLTIVNDRIVACASCPRLRAYCTQVGEVKKAAYRSDTYWARPVPGFGDPLAGILVIGLAPAAHGANRTGRVFTGDGAGGSGDFLMRAMHAAGLANIPTSRHPDDGLTLNGAYIGAAVRCAPHDNKPSPDEIAACQRHLAAELAALPRVRVLVCLGKIAFEATWRVLETRGLAVRPRPPFVHGAVYPGGPDFALRAPSRSRRSAAREGGPRSVIAAYHPSRQNTNTGRLTAPMLEAVFQQARRLANLAP